MTHLSDLWIASPTRLFVQPRDDPEALQSNRLLQGTECFSLQVLDEHQRKRFVFADVADHDVDSPPPRIGGIISRAPAQCREPAVPRDDGVAFPRGAHHDRLQEPIGRDDVASAWTSVSSGVRGLRESASIRPMGTRNRLTGAPYSPRGSARPGCFFKRDGARFTPEIRGGVVK